MRCCGRWLNRKDSVNRGHSDGTKMERWRNGNVTLSVNRPLSFPDITSKLNIVFGYAVSKTRNYSFPQLNLCLLCSQIRNMCVVYPFYSVMHVLLGRNVGKGFLWEGWYREQEKNVRRILLNTANHHRVLSGKQNEEILNSLGAGGGIRNAHRILVGNHELMILLCGNKLPTGCNRWFFCRFYCLLNMLRAPLCPSSGAREYYTGGCCLWCLVLWFSSCAGNSPQTGHITRSTTPYRQLENQSTKYDRQQPLV